MNEQEKILIHTSKDAKKRLQKRYRKERRFRFFGLLAILISMGFLFTLLFTIIYKGLPAFSQHFISLPFNMSNLNSADINSLKKANYDGIIRNAIREQFPTVKKRKDKKLLSGLISSGAPIILREQILANPQNINNPLSYEVPISDMADLYLKGKISSDIWREENKELEIINIEKNRVIINYEGDIFTNIFTKINLRLQNNIRKLTKQVEGLILSRDRSEQIIAQMGEKILSASEEEKERLIRERDREINKLNSTLTNIDKIKKQISKVEQEQKQLYSEGAKLDENDASFLLYLAQGVIKLEKITPSNIEGEILLPLQTENHSIIDKWKIRTIEPAQSNRKFSDKEIVWTDELVAKGYIKNNFNWIFLTRGASREAEMAGIWGAVVGSFLTLTITLIFAFPLGVAAAIYLEEFAPKNRLTAIIEVNINNLAAVPSIIFGLLGLAVFLNFFGLPRSAPLVGGMVLGLMTLPVIIIASRAALRSVPPSIREAALGIGASKMQTVLHHVLPLAMPGIMTGTIIGLAQALGETAPLLMIGMVAFIVDIPSSFVDSATVLPVQIYMWADFPEAAFEQKTSAAIMVLLAFLILMNALAVILRKKFERRW